LTIELFGEFGPLLTSRSLGAAVRERITEAAMQGETVIVSFAGVEAMSPSFADEIFAKVDQRLIDGGLVEVTDVDPRLQPIIRFVRAGRGPGRATG
jgi:hypothetical protein